LTLKEVQNHQDDVGELTVVRKVWRVPSAYSEPSVHAGGVAQAAGVPQRLSDNKERYRAFFQGLIDELRETYKFTNSRVGQPTNWYSFASENSSVYNYCTSFGRGGRVRVEFCIISANKEQNKQIFDCLLNQYKDEIESALGYELSWERLDQRKACRIAIYREGRIDDDSEKLLEIKRWAIDNLLKFKSVFPERIRPCIQAINGI
jgi:Domain of unknown function (DUF4268)